MRYFHLRRLPGTRGVQRQGMRRVGAVFCVFCLMACTLTYVLPNRCTGSMAINEFVVEAMSGLFRVILPLGHALSLVGGKRSFCIELVSEDVPVPAHAPTPSTLAGRVVPLPHIFAADEKRVPA